MRKPGVDERTFTLVYQEDSPPRLDKFLVACLQDFSRSRLQALIRDGFITINGSHASKSGQRLEPGDQIIVTIPPQQPVELQAEDISLDIVYEDDQVVVVNKPAGMVVHPAAGHPSGTLVNAALGHAPELEGIGGEQRPGVVHRLDKDTSGLIVMAKTDRAHRWLQDQFRLRKVEKIYLALVDGSPPTPRGRIEAPIGRSNEQRKQMAVVPLTKGREAVTEYSTREVFAKHTLLEVHPITGRTHQIRLHMKFLGCPVVGDSVYGLHTPSIPLARQFLHATRLSLILPGESQRRTFEALLPADLAAILEDLRRRGVPK